MDDHIKLLKMAASLYCETFPHRHGHQIASILRFPIRVALLPFTLALNVADSAQRGFGVPELISNLSLTAVLAIATIGSCDIALGLGRKLLLPRRCRICLGWNALVCTTCGGTGKARYQVKNLSLKRGEKATVECVADAILDDRAEMVCVPSGAASDMLPLPTRSCPTCDCSGVMKCVECAGKFRLTLSADNLLKSPTHAIKLMSKMYSPCEYRFGEQKIEELMLLTIPQTMDRCQFDIERKERIRRDNEEAVPYENVRDEVKRREPGWERLQEALLSVDPDRAKADPVFINDVPLYKLKRSLEAQLIDKLTPPPRPLNWGLLDLPLRPSLWGEDDHGDDDHHENDERTLDRKWEKHWREERVSEMVKDMVASSVDQLNRNDRDDVSTLHHPILITSSDHKRRRRWWWFL